MINILEFCLSPNYGGLEIHMKDFSFWLSNNSKCRLHISVRKDSRLHNALTTLKVPVLTFSSIQKKIQLLKAYKLASYIEENEIDVVHVHWKYDLLIVALAKRISNRSFKFVHTRQMSLPDKKFDPYHRFIYHSLDCFIAITKLIAKQAETNLPIAKEKIKQIYYGVDTHSRLDNTAIEKVKKIFSITGEFVVGLIGRISEFKGQHLLLRAIEYLKDEGISINTVIVGEPFDPKYLDKLKKFVNDKNLNERVKFLNFQSNPYELMNCFDALVLTTKRETFGLVLIEAMHCGIPVIGSKAGGVPEIIDEEVTGLLFESWNAKSLAGAIKKLYSDNILREKFALNGKEKARREFNSEIQYQKVIQAIRDLI